MNHDLKIGTYPFIVEDFHSDFTGKLSMHTLGNHLLNCSNLHSRERGLGIGVYNGQTYTWVISRLVVDFTEPIHKNEVFLLKTWISKVYNSFIDREYEVINNQGRTTGRAHSVWAMIDTEQRESINLTEVHGDTLINAVYDYPNPMNTKQGRTKVKNIVPCFDYTAMYSDLDINGHVNSIKYIEHAMNMLPIELFNTQELQRLEIAYAAESSYADRLLFYREEIDPLTFYIEIRKEIGEVVCRCKFAFKATSNN
ncbi:MAG: acyl-[acyl-carrier-protein] thioesterase [Bacteroidia bacterium]|nr:acyl-[acyl-carrier-protein] thioesterase [Bacteroidia bacterium]